MLTRLVIRGMTCQRCVQAVFTALTPVEGIVSADVSIGAAVVDHDGRATVARLTEAIAVAGYVVESGEDEAGRRRALPVL